VELEEIGVEPLQVSRGDAMALTIRAMRNNLGTSESPYYALASWSELVETDAFIDRMSAGRTTFTKTDIIAVF
jgi:hypothetical protein